MEVTSRIDEKMLARERNISVCNLRINLVLSLFLALKIKYLCFFTLRFTFCQSISSQHVVESLGVLIDSMF